MNDTTLFTVRTSGGSYPITLARGALAKVGSMFDLDRRVLIVTDEGVPTAYAEAVVRAAKEPHLVTVAAGEASKSLDTLTLLCREMLSHGFTRHDAVVAVGGGVVGDLAGFAASVYMRGIDFYNVPTTLLSQVDSSVGGKTAVNLDGIKNAVGAFYPPRGVLIDPDVLATLPARQIAAGLAEALKMATTFDAALFEIFEAGDAKTRLDEVILAALKIKQAVVEADEHEAGLRRVLNFGHTVGHAIESLSGLSEGIENGLYHGECVALGMLPMCAPAVRARLLPILRALALPTESALPTEQITSVLAHDKKATEGGICAVLVDEIGSFRLQTLTPDAIGARYEASKN